MQRRASRVSARAVDTRADSATSAASLVLLGVVACFFLSGFAALLYQTAWLRQFSLAFGTSELAVATVLAAYMAGLAAGAAVAARFVGRVRKPVLVYGLLEGGIAVSALAVPLLLAAAGAAYAAILGNRPEPPDAATIGQPIFYLSVAFLVLALPTACMGATLPMLTRHVVRADRDVGPRVALLYAVNTAGAVAGTVTAAFVLLPALGLRGTVWVGVAVNALVFAIAALLARGIPAVESAEPLSVSSLRAPRSPGFFEGCVKPLLVGPGAMLARVNATFRQQALWVLPLILVSGANAFFYEVLWTRLLSHVLGSSIYAFATMLAAFLGGIALGGGLAGKVAERRERAAHAFAVTQVAIAALSAAAYAWMEPLLPQTRAMAPFTLYAVLVMLPATIFIGATFPLAVRILTPSEVEAGRSTARVYAWNTIGAIVGAVLAGFFLIPVLGFEGSIKLAVMVNLFIAVWTAAFVAPRRSPFPAFIAVGLLLVFFFYKPERPWAVIERTAFDFGAQAPRNELYFAVGRSSTVLLREGNGKFDLRTNGLPEASVLMKGAPPLGETEKWLTALPLASRPQARSLLMIGFGGGVALEGIPSSVQQIDVVELEPEVIEANRRLAGLRMLDPLEDARINVVINDARNALRLTRKRYDVIVSQPSHPWTAGASHLFTREFLELAKAHLDEGGVLLQWMSTGFVDEALLRSLAATLAATFEHVRLYQAGGSILFFLASSAPLDIELSLAQSGRPINDNVLYYSYMGLNGVNDFVAALALDDNGVREFAAGAPLSTDDRNRMATQSRALSDGLEPAELMELLAPYDPLLDAGSFIYRELRDQLRFAYIANRLLAQGQQKRAAALASRVPDDSTRAMIAGLLSRHRGEHVAAREAFLTALDADPGNADARFVLIEPELTELAAGRASMETIDLARALSGSAAAVVRGWALAINEDWRSLAQLDNELAATNIADSWFPKATQLRADWRIQVLDEPRYAYDALRLIDRALLIRLEPELLMLRADAATVLDDADAVAESARYAVQYLDDHIDASQRGQYRMSASELAWANRHLAAWEARLGRLASDSSRARDVHERAEQSLRRAQRFARERGL